VRRRKSRLPEVIVLLGNSVRPRMEFLIGVARPYLSIVCQSLIKFFRFVCAGKKHGRTLSKIVLLVSIPYSRNLVSFYMNLECLANYQRGKKTQLPHCYWLWERLHISDVGTDQTNNDAVETFERGCRVNLLGN